MTAARFDYVIVGGGTAGCVLAARLSEDPATTVLLLEAGPRYRGLPIEIPAAVGALYEQGRYHWDYRSEPEPYAGGKRLTYRMGRIVGGSSAINGMVWVRGNPLDYDDWAAAGCAGWSWEDVEPVFRRIEDFEDPADPAMGHRGPIPVMRGHPEESPLARAFLAAAAEAGYPFNSNCNARSQDGFCALQRNARAGRRADVYRGYLAPALERTNLKILADATVRRIEIADGAATGVTFRHRGGEHRATALREVVLSAGSLASPQLLELSGVGDPEILRACRIEPVHVLPGVGRDLHTHPTVRVSHECLEPVSIYPATRPPGRWLAGIEWLLRRTGPAATTHFEAGAFLRSNPELDRPDLELTFLPLALDSVTASRDGHGFQVYVELVGCRSRGSTHVRSARVDDPPAFRFDYLEDERDVAALRTGVRLVRDLIARPAFDRYRGPELEPGVAVDDDAGLERWMRSAVDVSHHLVGSCRMGAATDPGAVVGPDLRVHGLDRLRVADASIMPRVTSANTQAAVVMIAERAADRILGCTGA